jgi:hypothetical protein
MIYGFFPIVHVQADSNTAENGMFGIKIDPKMEYYGAALAEERAEFAFKWKRTFWLIPIFCAAIAVIYWPIAFLGILIPQVIFTNIPGFNREVERVGQSVYASTASQCYGIPIDKALDDCVKSLTTEYSYFKGYDPELLRAELVQHLSAANKWFFKHIPTITKDIKKCSKLLQPSR